MNISKEKIEKIGRYTFLLTPVFLIVMGVMIARGDFRQPRFGPPVGDSETNVPFNTSNIIQRKQGQLEAYNFYAASLGRWLSARPRVRIIQGTPNVAAGTGVAYCDSSFNADGTTANGYQLIGCSGSRDPNIADNCDEGDCGIVGVIAIDKDGNIPAILPPVGCKVGIDQGTTPAVHAYCMYVTPL